MEKVRVLDVALYRFCMEGLEKDEYEDVFGEFQNIINDSPLSVLYEKFEPGGYIGDAGLDVEDLDLPPDVKKMCDDVSNFLVWGTPIGNDTETTNVINKLLSM